MLNIVKQSSSKKATKNQCVTKTSVFYRVVKLRFKTEINSGFQFIVLFLSSITLGKFSHNNSVRCMIAQLELEGRDSGQISKNCVCIAVSFNIN